MTEEARKELFQNLKAILTSFVGDLVESESEGKYALSNTKPIEVDGKLHEGYYFAGLRENKNIIGFYFMPVYTCPELRDQLPSGMAKLLKGNTCFNMKKLTPELEIEIREMMELGMAAYRAKSLM